MYYAEVRCRQPSWSTTWHLSRVHPANKCPAPENGGKKDLASTERCGEMAGSKCSDPLPRGRFSRHFLFHVAVSPAIFSLPPHHRSHFFISYIEHRPSPPWRPPATAPYDDEHSIELTVKTLHPTRAYGPHILRMVDPLHFIHLASVGGSPTVLHTTIPL